MNQVRRLVNRVLNPHARLDSLSDSPEVNDALVGVRRTPRSSLIKQLLGNLPLLIGSTIVLGLFLVTLFGPLWAPYNPYLTSRPIVTYYDPEERILVDPPLPPSPEFPLGTDRWGVDLFSLLLYGARNTLVACSFITMARILLGVILGGIAGWNESTFIDQAIMGALGVISSVPMLISSLILIYALDIRRGLTVFIIALTLIGWTEIAQYIRSEFLVLKNLPFIEGARSVGLQGFALAVRHVLPNILPQLLVITFLEMGAVMMLLGELGFIGAYIGGGSRISVEVELDVQEVFHLIEVPEWGAMLAEGFRYLRSRPFVVVPPSMAFFISVIGFNTLGEGLRRHIRVFGLNTARLLQKRMLLVIGFITAATVYIIQQTGPAPWFAKAALSFNGDRAYQDALTLASMSGRGHGQPGAEQAADYILEGFERNGLQPGWTHNSYIYSIDAQLVRPTEQPQLLLLHPDGALDQSFSHQKDFAFVIQGHGGSGQADATLTFVGFLDSRSPTPQSYQGLDLRGKIVLLQEGNAPADFPTEALIRGAQGVVWISSDDGASFYSEMLHIGEDRDFLRHPQLPIFKIRPQIAAQMLDPDGMTIPDLFRIEVESEQAQKGWFAYDLSARIRMSLQLQKPESYVIDNVIGFIPGSDFDRSDEMLVLFASYDGLGVDPDGTLYPAANHNGSGLATMLEIAHLWSQEGFNPRRSVLFVAWGTGSQANAAAVDFFNDPSNFRHLNAANLNRRLTPWLILNIDNAGAGGPAIQTTGDVPNRHLRLLQDSTTELEIDFVIDETLGSTPPGVTSRIPWVYLGWLQTQISPAQDTPDRLDKEHFQAFGEVLTLILTTMLRQMAY